MKIPKYIDNLIDKRESLAQELNSVDVQLCNWMEKKGMNLFDMTDYTRTGCMIYCEPENAAQAVRNAIIEYEKTQ